ncbi:hypothetical protein MLD38_015865 [Melastoma candidum]|uniref:Uncharacterized protein n=1 Tax=Melastoma candidum TaxID=119954 RepID=A0ACB9RLQ6_9MYRT|nr:hypothetical protein MLD38_015865 [Melastoma candidum]
MEGGESMVVANHRWEGSGVEDDDLVDLPPGFRFHPTDEEIISHYLVKKVVDRCFSACAMGEADLNKCEPWDLPKRAKMGQKEWYFFVRKDRKYPTGIRTNRATERGYWKATGKDKEIFRGKTCLVGMKKTLVFYTGRAPKGEKTNWVMHEFRLEGQLASYHHAKPSSDEWVVCKVFHKSTGVRKDPIFLANQDFLADSVPPLVEPASHYSGQQSSSFTLGEEVPDRDDGTGNDFCILSGRSTIDPNCEGDDTNVLDVVFGPQFPKYEYPPSLFSSYMHDGPHDSDYFASYGGTDNHHHQAIIRGPAADKPLKAEQFSSIISPPQDMVDANGKITSYSTCGDYAYEDHQERPPVDDPIGDILEYSWD